MISGYSSTYSTTSFGVCVLLILTPQRNQSWVDDMTAYTCTTDCTCTVLVAHENAGRVNGWIPLSCPTTSTKRPVMVGVLMILMLFRTVSYSRLSQVRWCLFVHSSSYTTLTIDLLYAYLRQVATQKWLQNSRLNILSQRDIYIYISVYISAQTEV